MVKPKSSTTRKKASRTKSTTSAKKTASRTKTKRAAKEKNGSPPSGEVTIDRRRTKDRRINSDRRKSDRPVRVERRKLQRRAKVNRRRQIDPTTCERDYSAEEVEFMNALDQYKRTSGRMFPTCSEVLEVLRDLGYRKVQEAETPAEETAEAGDGMGGRPEDAGAPTPA